MPPEATAGQTVTPDRAAAVDAAIAKGVTPLTETEQKASADFLKDHPALARALVSKMPGIANQELAALVGAEFVSMMQIAKAEVNRANVPGASSTHALGEKPKMSVEQQQEWLRVTLLRMTGQFNAEPRKEFDADGLVTQALTPISGSGAYMLPVEFIPEIEKKEDEVQNIWPLIRKVPTTTRTVDKPTYTDYPASNKGTAANVNSATTATNITETPPTWANLEWNLEDFDTRFVVKLDLIEESPVSIYEELVWCAADAFAKDHEREPAIGPGHGSKRPLGLLDAASAITAVAIGAAPSVDNILNFCGKLPQAYRARAVLCAPTTTFFKVASVFAQTINAPQFLMEINALPTMKEWPYLTEGKILIGDFSRYVVYYIRLMQIVTGIVPSNKTREIVITETWTGRCTIANAFRIGTGVTYT